MNKRIIIGICITILLVIIGVFVWIKLFPSFDKSNPIIFEKGSNEDYTYVIYQGREYVPYCAFSPKEREKYLGYVGNDKQDEIYTVKGYSEEEWLISYLDSEIMNDCMLLKEKNVTNIPEGLSSEYEWNNIDYIEDTTNEKNFIDSDNKNTKTSNIKNYDENIKIAYEDEDNKDNSEFIYYNNSNKDRYNWNSYIVENKIITKNMETIDFSKFEKLDNKFYSLKITDSKIYNEYAKKYNFRELKESDFENIFVDIVIRESTDYSISCNDIVTGYENYDDSSNKGEKNYTLPIRTDGILDVDENFKYPCIVGYFPNYMYKDYNPFYFKVLPLYSNIIVSSDNALEIAKNYLSKLSYGGVKDFSDKNFLRLINEYENNFIDTENKEQPIIDENKKHTVWSISAYSIYDPCTWANVYIDVNTGKVIGGKLYFATD